MTANHQQCTATPGCPGVIEDGYCNVCGMQPLTAANASPPATTSHGLTQSAPSLRSTASGTSLAGNNSGASRSSRGTSRPGRSLTGISNRQLGLGLVNVAYLPKSDPEKAVMAVAEVPVLKRYCSNPDCKFCETPMFIGDPDPNDPTKRINVPKPREKGFCRGCGTRYNFKPGLEVGDLVAGQYEIKGPIAFGGMGWIYLALDRTLNRWVVLKGLLNGDDPALAAAAVAERQYLAELKNPNIVGIYTFVTHENSGYIVMEYVGGKTLKSLRKERGPLPVSEAIAYIHRTLNAFAYMHRMGLVYCDFKPDNVLLEEDDIKLVDLGGVMRLGSSDAPVGTKGYYAPEVPKVGPSVVSDLYTIARALWVLTCDSKGYQNPKQFQFCLPTPDKEPLFARYESLYKWLLKGTHVNPEMRFQTAEEMAEQLLGVLRETVAQDSGTVKAAESTKFGGDPLSIAKLGERSVDRIDADSLPPLKRNSEDPASNFIVSNLSADLELQRLLFASAISQFSDSAEAFLGMAQVEIALGNFDEAEKYIAATEAMDGFDWRVIWYRGVSFLAQSKYADAQAAFETCYAELPGDLAPKLAIAMAAEMDGQNERAIALYNVVSTTDPSHASASFGLARCFSKVGKRDEAVAALGRIPKSSNLFPEAQKAMALALIASSNGVVPGEAQLVKASQVIEAIALAGIERLKLNSHLLQVALQQVCSNAVSNSAEMLLGLPLNEHSLRLGLEQAYLQMAKLETDATAKEHLVEQALAARPFTLF